MVGWSELSYQLVIWENKRFYLKKAMVQIDWERPGNNSLDTLTWCVLPKNGPLQQNYMVQKKYPHKLLKNLISVYLSGGSSCFFVKKGIVLIEAK